MTDNRDSRRRLAELARSSGVFELRDQGLENDFVEGVADPKLVELGIDSLAGMELCIAIENEWGVSIVPAELELLETLGEILRRVSALRSE